MDLTKNTQSASGFNTKLTVSVWI